MYWFPGSLGRSVKYHIHSDISVQARESMDKTCLLEHTFGPGSLHGSWGLGLKGTYYPVCAFGNLKYSEKAIWLITIVIYLQFLSKGF